MPRGRGGARQGTPGKAYTNRTDLTSDYNNAGSAAAGGMEPDRNVTLQNPQLPVYPEQTPNLLDPTSRPNEPISDGLPIGAGRGTDALTNYDPRVEETKIIARKWGPILAPLAEAPDTPDSVRTLVRYLRGF